MPTDSAPTVDPLEIIAQALLPDGVPAGEYQRARAAGVLEAFARNGIVLLRPSDIEYGRCRDHDGGDGPHVIALTMCEYCLEYDPD